MTGGSILLLLCLTAADSYEFRQRDAGWELRLNGQPVNELWVTLLPGKTTNAPALALDLLHDGWRARLDAIRRLPGSETDKQLYIAFLKRKYGYQIAAVNLAYGLEASAFTELESSDFAQADRAKLEPDDIEFTAELFAGSLEETRGRLSRGVLLLAVLPPDAPLALARRLAKTVDAFLVRDPRQDILSSKPYVLGTTGCATVRPPTFAACARISEP